MGGIHVARASEKRAPRFRQESGRCGFRWSTGHAAFTLMRQTHYFLSVMTTVAELKSLLISHSLFATAELNAAIERLGFIQADPIRSPARAQDLILRHRVSNYRVGDLETAYPSLPLEEDYTFAYGFLSRKDQALLHPRKRHTLSAFEKKVVKTVKHLGTAHPSALVEHCGDETVKNPWGGTSKASKCALERAHHYGHLRVARREGGIRVYEAARSKPERLPAPTRLQRLLLLTLRLFGPTSRRFLLAQFSQYRFISSTPAQRRNALAQLT